MYGFTFPDRHSCLLRANPRYQRQWFRLVTRVQICNSQTASPRFNCFPGEWPLLSLLIHKSVTKLRHSNYSFHSDDSIRSGKFPFQHCKRISFSLPQSITTRNTPQECTLPSSEFAFFSYQGATASYLALLSCRQCWKILPCVLSFQCLLQESTTHIQDPQRKET